jgi:hypothetical protein
MVLFERVDGCTQAGVNDYLEEGESRANGVGLESQSGSGGQKAIHDIIWIRGYSNEEKKLWTPLYCHYDALHGAG